MQFEYTAKTKTGQRTAGLVDAASTSEALVQLRQRGFFPLSVSAARPAGRAAARSLGHGRRRRVSRTDVLMLTSQLAIMCRSGVELAEALENLAARCPHPALKTALDAVYRDVSEGLPVSVALKKQPHVFDEAYVAAMAAGETSGKVPDILGRLADLMRNEIRLRSTVRGVLAYPIVLTTVALGVVLAMVFFVLPQFGKVFDELEAPAPVITRLLLDFALFVEQHLFAVLIGLAAGAVLIARGWRTTMGRRLRDGIVLNGFVVRDASRALLTGRAFRLLGSMLQSGIPILEALALCQSSIRNIHYRALFDQLHQDVLNGKGMSAVLETTPFVPSGAAQMVATAERAGSLGSVLVSVGEFYEDDGERKLRELSKLLEPVIIVCMGAVVTLVVLAVILPLLDLSALSS